MDRCPTEVLRLIITALKEDEDEETCLRPQDLPELMSLRLVNKRLSLIAENWLGPKDLPKLMSLRLVNKRLSLIASGYLFKEVVVNFHTASYEKMVAIAQHPKYRTHVRQLRISPRRVPSPLLDRQQFENWLHGDRNLLGDPRLSHVNGGYFPLLGHDGTWDDIMPHLDGAYQEYKQTYLDQLKFIPKAEAMLQSSISQFGRLTHVLSGINWPHHNQSWQHGGAWKHCCRHRGVHPLTHAWEQGAALEVFDMDQAESIFRAVARGQSRSGAQIDVTSLLQDCDTRIMDPGIANGGSHLVQDLTTNTEQLNVYFNSFSMEGLTDLVTTGRFTNFLASLTKLSNITCSTRRLNGSRHLQTIHTPQTFSLTNIFANKIWPHLTTLTLERFITSEAELMSLLGRHKPSLRILSLQTLLFSKGSWNAVFANLRGGVLQQLGVYHLGYRESEYKDFDEAFLNDLDYSRLGFLEESHPLHRFVIRNEPWDNVIMSDLAIHRKCWSFRQRWTMLHSAAPMGAATGFG